jgi:predicted  nucleic acid-binding Zn-ribbon protein
MPDSISESELAALTRRYESTCTDIETIKSDVLHVRAELSDFKRETRHRFERVDRQFTDMNTKIDGLSAKMDRNQAQIIELLSELVGRNPND